MALQATDIADVINTTINRYGRMKITDLMSDYNNTIAVKRTLKKNKLTFDGGPNVVWNLLTDTNRSARMVPIGATDIVDIPNVTAQGQVPWRGMTFNWAMDSSLISMNSGSAEKIFDIVQTQRLAAMGDAIKLFENKFWRCPASTSTLDPFGLEYWIVKSATEGFNGTVGSGFTVVGNISPTTYARWRNWTNGYSAISKPDLVRKMRRAMWETDFDLLVDDIPSYNTGDDYAIYCNYVTWAIFQELAESQNDDLGTDLASMDGDGRVTFRRRPFQAVKELENDTTNPIWGVNWGEFKAMALGDWWMRETHIPVKSDQHTLAVTHTDVKWNWFCRNRRRNFCISNGTTAMA